MPKCRTRASNSLFKCVSILKIFRCLFSAFKSDSIDGVPVVIYAYLLNCIQNKPLVYHMPKKVLPCKDSISTQKIVHPN